MDKEVEKIPGVIWNFSQPIADNMEEAVSGVKGELAVKLIGTDLKQLEQKADEIVDVMQKIPGVADLGVFRVVGPAQCQSHRQPATRRIASASTSATSRTPSRPRWAARP